MRKNWEPAGPLMLTQDQQNQDEQKQRTVIQEMKHHPLQSPTTPPWSIGEGIVKEEMPNYKNLGVFSGTHTTNSTSPGSGRSSFLEDEFDENNEAIPRFNSQGKMKTFKCKQCGYVAVTKLEFWKHSKCHIKPEKLLNCPKCAFVTEYKHHLEYHINNHYGTKPFRCKKCEYSCVNKSMLNSHLKSHSNIYPYRCANCTYVTKYIHSLKLHLRKYNHEPAMVLNSDGSPNPLPIIDVYGTRRGPKQKQVQMQNESQYETQSRLNNNAMNGFPSAMFSSPMMFPSPMSSIQNQINMSIINRSNEINSVNGINEMNITNKINELNGNNEITGINGINGVVPNPVNLMSALSFNQFLSGLSLPNALFGKDVAEKVAMFKAFLEFTTFMNGKELAENNFKNNLPLLGNIHQNDDLNPAASDTASLAIDEHSISSNEDNNEDEIVQPLDLSVSSSTSPKDLNASNYSESTSTYNRK